MTITTASLPAGRRAIPDGLHAKSAQVQTWSDMCGVTRGDLQIMDVLQNGYPRTFIDKDIKEVR